MRKALVRGNDIKAETIARYLPENYEVIYQLDDGRVLIAGEDDHGWTMEDYVIPRLNSGLYGVEEIT